MDNPKVDSNGSFEKILPLVPKDWPWVLPSYFAVNVVSDPRLATVGWTASPDGESHPHSAYVSDHSQIEIIGFWQNTYILMNVRSYMGRLDAEQEAKKLFATQPTKYLMQNGEIIDENHTLLLTGDWPANWEFTQIRDLGVFFCYLVMLAQSQGETERAKKVKESLSFAWPPTELILSYQNAFQLAQRELGHILEDRDKITIQKALKTMENWLRR